MAISAMARIYCTRLGRHEMHVSDVPTRWRGEVEAVFSVKGHPSKAELIEKCKYLLIPVPSDATNPQLAALIQALYEEVA